MSDAACSHESQHFDRSLCGCGTMHTYCNDCGEVLDGCPLDDEPAAARIREFYWRAWQLWHQRFKWCPCRCDYCGHRFVHASACSGPSRWRRRAA